MLTADTGFSELELYSEPEPATEVATVDIPAEIDTSVPGNVLGPVLPETFTEIEAEIQAETIEPAEPFISDFLSAAQSANPIALDVVFGATEPEELYGEDGLAIDFQLPQNELSRPLISVFDDQEPRDDDQQESSQRADQLRTFGEDEHDLLEQQHQVAS